MSDNPRNENQQPKNNGSKPPYSRMPRGTIGWILFFGMAMLLFLLLGQWSQKTTQLTVEQFRKDVMAGQVQKVSIRTNSIVGQLKPTKGEEKPVQFQVEVRQGLLDNMQFYQSVGLANKAGNWNVPTTFDANHNVFMDVLISTLPWLLIFGFVWFILFRQLRMASGGAGMLGNFGRSRHRVTTKEHTNITFADVAGVEEAKEEVTEIVEFLKNPRKFQRLGGRIPRGVLLVGEPGCGKTLLAKAIAGEAEVPFFSISGSDFR